METIEILKRAKALISYPPNWTIGAIARDHKGDVVGINDANAVSFCAIGALSKVCADAGIFYECFEPALEILDSVTYCKACSVWNDSQGHQATLYMFDQAIAKLEKRPYEICRKA